MLTSPLSRLVGAIALFGAIVSVMWVTASAIANEAIPDPLSWVPFPDHAGVSWVWVTAVGGISLDASFGDVTWVDSDGWLRIEERRASEARWVLALPQVGTDRSTVDGAADGAGSGVRVRYVVDGREAAWDDAARAWLAGLVAGDAALVDALRALGRGRSGGSGGNLTTSDGSWVSVVQVDPSMLETFGPGLLGWTLFGLGGPHPIDPGRPRLEPDPSDVAAQVQEALFVAHQLAAHGLVTSGQLEAFLSELAELARPAEGEARRTPPAAALSEGVHATTM